MTEWPEMLDAQGFVVLRGVVDADLIQAAKRRTDRLWCAWQDGRADQEFQGIKVLKREQADGSPTLDGIQGGHRKFPELRALRNSPVIAALLERRLGRELVSVVDTLFFKPPNQPGTGIAFHRDAQFRRPPEKFRDLDTRYVQVGFPLERHGTRNGGLILIEGSHRDLSIDALQPNGVRGVDDLSSTLKFEGMRVEAVEMEPGDIVLWHPQTIHGSPPNRSRTKSRRFYVVGYMSAAYCDLGDPL